MNIDDEQLIKLKKEQERLQKTIDAIKTDLRGGLDAVKSEQAVQLENYEVLMELLRLSESELNEVNNQIYQLENACY